MNNQTSVSKSACKTVVNSLPASSSSKNAVAVVPPDYGIDFVDNDSPKTVMIQRMGMSEEGRPLQTKLTSKTPTLSQQRPTVTQLNSTGLPDNLKSGIEHLSGYSMDDVKVHYQSTKPAQLQAHAYAQGSEIYLGSGQEHHLPHEAWHVVQQKQGRVNPTMQMKRQVNVNDDAALEVEADVMGSKATVVMQNIVQETRHDSVSIGQPKENAPCNYGREGGHKVDTTRGALLSHFEGNKANATIQLYKDPNLGDSKTWRASDDDQAMLEIQQTEGGQMLYATKQLIGEANTKLKTAGQKGSFIRLLSTGANKKLASNDLEQVLPKFVDASGAETFNKDMAKANKPGGADSGGDTQDWFKMYADCGRSSRTVMGSLGLGPKALYKTGTKNKETARAFNPEVWTDKVYLESMKSFVKDPVNLNYLKKEHLTKRFGAYFRAEANKYKPKTPTSGKEAKQFAGYLDEDGQLAFAKYAKINVAVNPEIGEGYTMATGYDLPGFTGGANAWNFHWAGVVMKAGGDNVTLENYAIMFNPTGDPVKDEENQERAYNWTNTEWVFQMYGTVKKGQTFHEEHLTSGTHGTRGTTFRVKI
jgi:hypothetical protein